MNFKETVKRTRSGVRIGAESAGTRGFQTWQRMFRKLEIHVTTHVVTYFNNYRRNIKGLISDTRFDKTI